MLFILGILDLVSGVWLVLLSHNILAEFGFVLGVYLIIKGLCFLRSFSSIVDIMAGVVMLLLFYGINIPLYWLFSLWLIQKGVLSIICKS